MKKIIVIGSPGAGKSVFSQKLSKITQIHLYHIDKLYHKEDGTHISKEELEGKLKKIFKNDSWIIDGNYQRTLEMRVKECDTIFLLDFPTEVCLEGAKSRIGKKREDLPWVEEKLGVTNKTTSRWENGHYLPDIEMMQLLSKEFSISINELISGEKINDLDYKEKAEENLIVALENSTFTLKEKIEFHKKKWLKEHIFDIVLCIIVWLVVIVALKLQNAEGYLIGTISGILAVFFYVVRYNQMMIYVEDRVYKKIEK